jgi:2'-5' RNA ligase
VDEPDKPRSRTIGVAIAIPDPFGQELQRWREHFGDPLAGAIPSHVTLLPPTTVPDCGALEKHLLGIAEGELPFSLHLRGTASFRPVSPVVFVAVAEGISDCERLEKQIRSGPLDRELRFNYHPHVTIAHDLPDERLDAAFRALQDYDATFTVSGFSLYEHGHDGVWRRERDFSFGGGIPG